MKINFDAGPSTLPQSVLTAAAAAIVNYNDSGSSILEIPHRGQAFKDILEEANVLVKSLYNISDDYDIIWMQGGGRMQFAMIPLNFLQYNTTAAYIDSGHWSKSAIGYAEKYGSVQIVASSKDSNYNHIPTYSTCPTDSAYLHITSNNTIYGTQYQSYPSTGNVPLIADMSSDIFSRRIDVSKFGFIYAAAQKNVGPAGVTLGIIRKDLSKHPSNKIPSILRYSSYVSENSLINTPPVFAIYCSYLNLKLMHQKGIVQIEHDNNEKARLLYDFISQSTLFNTRAIANFSKMNVCLELSDAILTQSFVDYAAQHDIIGVKGHRSIGGVRISLYNAISKDDVTTLIDVMRSFEQKPIVG